MMHLCLRLLSPVSSCRAATGLEPAAVPSALDREAAMRDSLAFELHQAAEAQETLCVAAALAGARPRLDRLQRVQARRVDRPPVGSPRAERIEGPAETAQALLP